MSKLSPADVVQIYGDAVKQWQSAREQLLLDQATRNVFSNAFLEGMGLTAKT
jgi:hypothetical protein